MDLFPWDNLFLVRHGESTCNEVNRFAGSVDAPLTALGRAQARRAAESWREPAPDRIYVSPLSRAIETAEILIPADPDAAPFCVDSRIAERDFGDFTMRNKAELQRVHGIGGYDEALYDASGTMVGAESFEDFHGRVAEFLFETVLPRLKAGERVLIVAHKYVVELMARLILEIPQGNGFDLRLPNSRVIRGGDLGRYCWRENRSLNRLRDWVVLRHDWLLSAAAVAGLVAAWGGLPIPMPWPAGIVLLMLATAISLTRVDLDRLNPNIAPGWLETLVRYGLLPGGVAWVGLQSGWSSPWLWGAIVLAAPAALTSMTLSRCAGGLVLPAVGAILRSSAAGCIAMVLLLQLPGISGSGTLAPLLLGVALFTILVPAGLAAWARRVAPIATASFGERQAALSVMVLGIFVFGASARLDLESFSTCGVTAIAASLAARVAAWLLARRESLAAADDYLSMAYPNLFLVIILGQLLGQPGLTQTATWFLLPMFLLSPFDLRACGKLVPVRGGDGLGVYLGIRPATSSAASGRDSPIPEPLAGACHR